jgi:hypothetical protein
MSEKKMKLCPMTRMLSMEERFACMEDFCAWWVETREVMDNSPQVNYGTHIRVPGHCAILDIGRGR